MSVIETNSLIEELKNLNSDLSGGLKDMKRTTIDLNSKFNNSISTITPIITSTTPTTSSIPILPPKQPLNMDGLSDFVLSKTEELVINGLDTVKDLQQTVGLTMDGKVIAAFANVIAATNTALATLNAINIERSKQKAAKELKEMDIAAKKAIGPANNTKNVVNLIANREVILKMLEETSNTPIKGEIIDLTSDDYSVQNTK
jgi:hypothetical protein